MNFHPNLPEEQRRDAAQNGVAPIYSQLDYGRDGYAPSDQMEDFNFWGTLSVILSRKWLILAILIAGTSIAAGLGLREVPLFKSVATIEIQKEALEIFEGTSVEQSTTADAEYMATQFQLLRSRSLAERVAEELNLSADPRYANINSAPADRLQQAANTLVGNLSVYPSGRSRLVNVEFTSPHQEETARIANAVVDIFIKTNLERRYNTTAYAREFLEERIASTKAILEAKERELVDYATEADILELNDGDGAVSSLDATSIISLNGELAAAESRRIEAEQIYLESLNNSNIREIVDNEALREMRTQLAELSAEYESKLATYQPQFPDMVKLQSRVNSLKSQIALEQSSIRAALYGDYNSALARENSLRARVRQLRGQLQGDRDRRVEYNILQREVDTNRSQYDALLQRLKEVSISDGIGSSQVQIVDAALIPAAPFAPNIRRSLISAFVMSLVFGIMLAFVLNFIDDTIKSPEDAKKKLGLTAIGAIPKLSNRKQKLLEVISDPKSPISEAYLSASAGLKFVSSSGTPKSILVTSTRPGEGKSSTSYALARTFARNNKKVLIIDADLRKPSFVSEPGESIGLSGLLTDEGDLEENTVQTDVENLFLLPAGLVPPSPAELLSSYRLQEIISLAEDSYDVVIIDSPPVLAFADAPLLGGAVSGVLIVVEAGTVRRPAALRTINKMYETRSNVLGVVLTKFDHSRAQYEYGYYYSNYSNYGDAKLTDMSSSAQKRRINILQIDNEADSDLRI